MKLLLLSVLLAAGIFVITGSIAQWLWGVLH